MGESCCGGKPTFQESPAVQDATGSEHKHHEDHDHGRHSHDYGHDNHHDHKNDDHGCCGHDGDASGVVTGASTCCGTEECCDEKCIENIANVECRKACDEAPRQHGSSDHPHEHRGDEHNDSQACDTHLRRARDMYGDYIKQLRCICRSAIERGLVSSQDCCYSRRHEGTRKRRKAHSKDKATKPTFAPSSNVKDLEKQGKGDMQTVKFIVSGMDCTSCGDKLTRILGSMSGVSDTRVHFITGTGELSLDTTITTADEVLRFASTASGFDITRVAGGDYFLDVLTSSAQAKHLRESPPNGGIDVEILDKKTTRISYDPAATGARDLYDSVKDLCQGLAQPRANPQLESSKRRLWDQLIKTSLAAVLTIPVAVISFSEDLVSEKVEGIIGLVLGTFVQLIAVPEFYRPALSALWYSRTVEMDMLVVMSITAAYGYSVVAFGFSMAGKTLEEGQFFETSTLLITLILMGRLIAAFARVQAVAAVSLRSRQNTTALLIGSDGDREIDARLLQYGDRFRLLPHSRVPTDGVILEGETEIDESMLTGESIPVPKKKGTSVIAGTLNGDGTVVARLVRLPRDNTVSEIAQLVEDAANSKPKLQDLANKVAGWFVPVMAVITVLILIIWIACGIELLDYSAGRAVAVAITYAVATLAVACPCALGLAVPMVLVVAGGISARNGVVIKSADTTEGARKTTDVVFDKTGTITQDELSVAEHTILDRNKPLVLGMIKALVAGGKHPVSAALDRHLKDQGVTAHTDVQNVRVVPGAGVQADFGGSTLMAGNSRWTKTDGLAEVGSFHRAGMTTFVLVRDHVPLAVFGLHVQLRPEAKAVVGSLKKRGIKVHLVSGDQKVAVETVAQEVGIPSDCVASERTPAEKQAYIAALMEDKSRYVLFCGDGTNDAVAVAQANVGVQMGGGLTSSEVTQGAADVVLLNGLQGIPFLLDCSKAAFNRMFFNFMWSAIYNVLAVTMASGAWIKIRIPPRFAGLGEMVSVIPVILAASSMLLLNLKKNLK